MTMRVTLVKLINTRFVKHTHTIYKQ